MTNTTHFIRLLSILFLSLISFKSIAQIGDSQQPPLLVSVDSCCWQLWKACKTTVNDSAFCDLQFFCCVESSTFPTPAAWKEMPFDASNFTASSGSWLVVDADEQIRYQVISFRTMVVDIQIPTSQLNPFNALTLMVKIPNGATTREVHSTVGKVANVNANHVGRIWVEKNGNQIFIEILPAQFFSVVSPIEIRGQIIIEI